MKFSEKLPAFANPQGAAGKLLIASMNIFHTPVSLWGISHLDLAGNEKSSTSAAEAASTCPAFKESSPRPCNRHRSFTGLRELFFYAQPRCHCRRTVFRL